MVNDKDELLVIQEQIQSPLAQTQSNWKLPGGQANIG